MQGNANKYRIKYESGRTEIRTAPRAADASRAARAENYSRRHLADGRIYSTTTITAKTDYQGGLFSNN